MNFRFPLIVASALLALSATTPVFAQGAGGAGSGGDGGANSLTGICKTRMDQQQLLVTSMTDPSKKAAAMQELDMAKASSTAGNAAACVSHLDKVEALGK